MKKYQNEKTKTSAKVSTKGFKFKHTEEEEKSEFKLPEGEEVFFTSLPDLQNAQGLFPDAVMNNFSK